jgi:two-component system response regulator GlrR
VRKVLIIGQASSFEADLAPEWNEDCGICNEYAGCKDLELPELLLRIRSADAVVVACYPEPARGLQLLASIAGKPPPSFAVLPAQPSSALVEEVALHARDFLANPVHPPEFRVRLLRLLNAYPNRTRVATERLLEDTFLGKLVGAAPPFKAAVSQLGPVARSSAPVLITGETGTGKELCARAIHNLSARRPFPFIPVDCGAFPDHLFENEVFGHVRGAYTDAHSDQKGLAAMAERGTLFLDEVDALSLVAQAKLLRFLQERTFKPLGSERVITVEVKVIAASNRDLEWCVRQQSFRSDLFFRLNVLRIHLPPLRERTGDIGLLARHFLNAICSEPDMGPKTLSAAALARLQSYDWPGNARELYNTMQRAAVLAEDGAVVLPQHISTQPYAIAAAAASLPFRDGRAQAVQSFERTYIQELMTRHEGNITRAAREAGKDRRAFGRLVKKYKMGA